MEVDESFNPRMGDDSDNITEFECFQLLFSDEILDLLVKESNIYYEKELKEKYGEEYRKIISESNIHFSYAYLYVTKGITKVDILAFIAIRIYMGLHRYTNMDSYWVSDGLTQNKINKIMSKQYFFLIAKTLHFPEKEEKEKGENDSVAESQSQDKTENASAKVDPRHKINLYLEKLAKNFQKYYELGRNITIDESLIHFKGRNSMKFYIPMKPYKHGFKLHLLCDSDTNYLYNMLLDPGRIGKDFINLEDNSSTAESVVLRLLSCINDNKQRNIFFDGWYSSISLMKKLTKMGYLNTTVLRNTSKEIPPKLKLQGYDKAYNDEILIQKYEGKKTILFATNYQIDKEELRNMYNIKNRGVDTFDHYLEISSIQRRSKKWYKKILLFGIDASIINAKILFELKTGKSYTTIKFKEKIIEQIFNMYFDYKNGYCKKNLGKKKSKKKPKNEDETTNDTENASKSEAQSESQNTPNTNLHSIGIVKKNRIRCRICDIKTPYICVVCNVHLHPECFVEFHQKKEE